MYIEAILKVKKNNEYSIAEIANHINNILSTDYPNVEIVMAREQDNSHKIEIDFNSDWEEIIMRRINNGSIK